jgi:hypothetical protein
LTNRGIASSAACNSGRTRTVNTLAVVLAVLLGRQVRQPFFRCWRPIRGHRYGALRC